MRLKHKVLLPEALSHAERFGWLLIGAVMIFATLCSATVLAGEAAQVQSYPWACKPTQPDMLGPFYKPNAPVRSSVGTGYELTGVAKSAKDCSPLPGAKIEIWVAGPNGQYDDAHRATVIPDPSGHYRFQSNFPLSYGTRPPHLHVRVSAEGYKTLVTQHYPERGKAKGALDLVLVPDIPSAGF